MVSFSVVLCMLPTVAGRCDSTAGYIPGNKSVTVSTCAPLLPPFLSLPTFSFSEICAPQQHAVDTVLRPVYQPVPCLGQLSEAEAEQTALAPVVHAFYVTADATKMPPR